jgi:hypothetical protein
MNITNYCELLYCEGIYCEAQTTIKNYGFMQYGL